METAWTTKLSSGGLDWKEWSQVAYATASTRMDRLQKTGSAARPNESQDELVEMNMRQSFDKKIPVWQQRLRVMNAKTPGHKHGTKRRSWKVKEEAKKRALHLVAMKRKFKAKVREFWTGERDGYPKR